MTDSIITIVATAVVLLLMEMTFLYFYFRSIRHELQTEWLTVLDKLRLRLDKIPNLLETAGRHAPESATHAEKLIRLRSECWPMEKADKEMVHKELAVSSGLKEIWALGKKNTALARDTNFLSLKTEFKEIEGEIESFVDAYNNHVRKYNGKVRFILFLPVSMMFGFRKVPVFEFEA